MSPILLYLGQVNQHVKALEDKVILKKFVDDELLRSITDLAELPVLNWPSVYMFICFRKLWRHASRFLELLGNESLDVVAVSAAMKEYKKWLVKFMGAADDARDGIRRFS
jgi:hypothetical protein